MNITATSSAKYQRILRKTGIILTIFSFVTFVLLMMFWLTAPNLVCYTVIGLFILGILLLILQKPFGYILSKIISPFDRHKLSVNKFYLITTTLLVTIIGILTYKLINKTPAMYDCLKLGSDMARRACVNYYKINE